MAVSDLEGDKGVKRSSPKNKRMTRIDQGAKLLDARAV